MIPQATVLCKQLRLSSVHIGRSGRVILLIQGIGSIVSIFFFAIVPLVIALTLFVAFSQTQIDIHRKRKYHSCGMLIHGEVPAEAVFTN